MSTQSCTGRIFLDGLNNVATRENWGRAIFTTHLFFTFSVTYRYSEIKSLLGIFPISINNLKKYVFKCRNGIIYSILLLDIWVVAMFLLLYTDKYSYGTNQCAYTSFP
jgi:hypothetical protein